MSAAAQSEPPPRPILPWRFAALAGIAVGLGLSPLAAGAAPPPLALAVPAAGALGLAAARPRGAGVAAWPWLALVALLAALAGLALGAARVAAIDGGALRGPQGRAATATGFVTAVPRRARGEIRVEVATPAGRLAVRAPEPVPDLAVGSQVRARGELADPDPFLAGLLRRRGAAVVLEAERLELTGGRRGGIAGALDRVRDRAEAALERGMRERESALARGFLLGQSDRIDGGTAEDFKRAGLAHLLAVSGQHVLLLSVLGMLLLAVAGLPLRGRLIGVLALIAIYVPVAGAGPSIQRAGVMGAAGIVAALASRPRSRAYALLLAAAATLALNPRASGDVGWQLSFAAVVGILLWTGRLAALLPGGGERGTWRRALAQGAALTTAATLATAPLMAHHFDAVPAASLPANLLALPAVAPSMWLSMLAAIGGQLDLPVEPINRVNSLLLAYIAQVASWLGSPSWALAPIRLPSAASVAAAYAAMLVAAWIGLRWVERRRGLGSPGPAALRGCLAAAAAVAIAAVALPGPLTGGPAEADPVAGRFSMRVLDVGQGDAILLDPPDGDPVLVDGGPPGAGLGSELAGLGVETLAAAVVTHDESDHSGGIVELLGQVPIGRLAHGAAGRRLLGAASAAGVEPVAVAEGGELRSGSLRLSVLWPPRALLEVATAGAAGEESGVGPAFDPNALSLVILAEWGHFSVLLTGDAEAEAVPIDPGPVDVLKVAHHGSEDAGLPALLGRIVPRAAVIAVGENSYGHPTPETLAALAAGAVRTLRTDEDGTVTFEADGGGWWVAGR